MSNQAVLDVINKIDAERSKYKPTMEEFLISSPKNQEIRTKVMQYFSQNGIEITEKAVDDAVNAYLFKRFDYKESKVVGTQDFISKILFFCLAAKLKQRQIIIALTAILVAVIMIIAGSVISSNYAHKQNEEAFAMIQTDSTNFIKRINDMRVYEGGLFITLSDKLDDLTHRVKSVNELSRPDLEDSKVFYNTNYRPLGEKISSVEKTVESFKRYQTVINGSDYKKLQDNLSVIEVNDKALSDIRTFSTDSNNSVNSLAKTIDKVLVSYQLVSQFDSIKARYSVMLQDTAAKEYTESALATIKTYAEAGDKPSMENALVKLNDYYTLFKTPAKMEIYVGNDNKSGVERTFDSSGNKKWYLIAQVKGYDNRVMSYPVLDQESGKVVNAKIFGIEVPRSIYQQVGSEKKSTGMIKQRIVATKDANTMQFNNKISVNNGFITNW
jgi:hypothetical protein